MRRTAAGQADDSRPIEEPDLDPVPHGLHFDTCAFRARGAERMTGAQPIRPIAERVAIKAAGAV